MSTEIADAEVVEAEPRSTAIVARPATLEIAPQADASQLVARLSTIRDAMQTAMVEDVDYGKIPGTDKPTLYKPGAEKLAVLFQLDVQYENEERWNDDHLTVFSHATVFHQPTGLRLGAGEGVCSTREKKYGKRKAQRECPECGKPAIIKGKQEYGGGWVCFKKKDGCGAKFGDDDQRIASQQVGEVDNPDLPDAWNTVVKMAKKRALVDAVLVTTSASALFTQDAEDTQAPPPVEDKAPAVTQPFDPSLKTVVGKACTSLAGGQPALGKALFEVIKADCGGVFPQAAALAVIACAGVKEEPVAPEVQ